MRLHVRTPRSANAPGSSTGMLGFTVTGDAGDAVEQRASTGSSTGRIVGTSDIRPSGDPRSSVVPVVSDPETPPTTLAPISVAFADDSYLVREAIAYVLSGEPRVRLVAVCEDRWSLLGAVEETDPAVVVTDIRMPPSGEDEGIWIANELRRTHPAIGVVVLSQYADPRYALTLLEHGSDGRAYLLKERVHDRGQLVAAIETVAHGGSVIDAKVVETVLAARSRAEESPLADLTARELEILGEIAQGKSNAAIAESLVLTKRAVEKHINAIFLKLNLTDAQDVSRRVKAALIYVSEESHGALGGGHASKRLGTDQVWS
jgi:DNA-binding NarL/FixJ family response regulator